jgi:hypothetical protein
MKTMIQSMRMVLVIALIATYLAGPATVLAAEKADKEAKAKPYPLKTCIISDEALGGDHGDPYVFVHQNQEFKLCCKPCLKDFNKEPKTYHKKLAKLVAEQKKNDKQK